MPAGAQDGAGPKLMGLASLGLDIGISAVPYDCSVLLLSAISGVDCLGPALCPGRRCPLLEPIFLPQMLDIATGRRKARSDLCHYTMRLDLFGSGTYILTENPQWFKTVRAR